MASRSTLLSTCRAAIAVLAVFAAHDLSAAGTPFRPGMGIRQTSHVSGVGSAQRAHRQDSKAIRAATSEKLARMSPAHWAMQTIYGNRGKLGTDALAVGVLRSAYPELSQHLAFDEDFIAELADVIQRSGLLNTPNVSQDAMRQSAVDLIVDLLPDRLTQQDWELIKVVRNGSDQDLRIQLVRTAHAHHRDDVAIVAIVASPTQIRTARQRLFHKTLGVADPTPSAKGAVASDPYPQKLSLNQTSENWRSQATS